MPTKKKGLARKLRSSPKGWKSRNKLREYVKVLDKKVPLLIRSSGRNQSLSKSFPKIRDIPSSKDLDSNFFSRNEIKDIFLRDNPFDSTNIDVKEYSEDIAHVQDTIFSPAFHISRYVAGGTGNRVDFIKFFGCDEEQIYENRKIWKSQHSKFENVDEASEDTMSTEFHTEPEQSEEIHDFDSYLFIKKLPDLSLVVPTFRPMLLPKKTRSCPPTTLVLDLDETLVHSELEPISDPDITFSIKFDLMEEMVYVRCRPHLNDFLERVANLFEVVLFTASQKIYAEQLLNILDPKRKLFRHRAYRESCIFVKGNYLKDLSVLGRDLARVIIIDNSPEAFGFQVNNGIPIKSWFNDHLDQELLLLLPFLESLARVEDVRPLIEEKYNLQENIAAAVILHSTLSK